jgi:hypothetical protein
LIVSGSVPFNERPAGKSIDAVDAGENYVSFHAIDGMEEYN